VIQQGLSVSEAATNLDRTEKAVQKNLERGRAALQKLFQKKGYFGAAGGLALDAVLSEASQAAKLPSNRAAELAASILAKAQVTVVAGKPLKKLLLVGGVLLTAGLAYGGVWAALAETESQPSRDAPTSVALSQSTTPVVETLQAKNKRIFLSEVRPKLLAAFQPLITAVEGGSVELNDNDISCHDTRVVFILTIHHGEQNKSCVRVIHETRKKTFAVFLDYLSKGFWKWIDPNRPLYSDFPKFEIKFPGIKEINPILLATDFSDRRESEEWDKFSHALRKYGTAWEGIWYEQGNTEAPVSIRFTPDERFATKFRFGNKPESEGSLRDLIFVREDGQLEVNRDRSDESVLEPDGQRIVFPQMKTFWTRQPTMAKGKKE
jgi:hypothetical protein